MEEELCGRDPNKPREPSECDSGLRTEIVIIPGDYLKPPVTLTGFTCFEEVGVGFYNPKGITKLQLGDKE